MPARWRQVAAAVIHSYHLLALAVAAVITSAIAVTLNILSNPWSISAPDADIHLEVFLSAVILLLVLFIARYGIFLRQEIHRRRRAEAAAELSAHQDVVTGLPNRTAFEKQVATTLSDLPRGSSTALMLLDIVGLQDLINLRGFTAGDNARQAAARRLEGLVENAVIQSKLEGDCFAFLIAPGKSRSQITQIAGRIITLVSQAYEIDGRTVRLGTFLGIAVAPADGSSSEDLMRAAHVSLGRAKNSGLNTYCFFDPEVDLAMRERALLRSELSDAITGGQIVPFYQPMVNLAHSGIDGFEVLARWHHPSRGVLSADKFVSFAEDMDLIHDLTRSIVRQACMEASAWAHPYRISVNISPQLLHDEAKIGQIVELVRGCDIEASRLEFEITESALILDANSVRESVDRLRSIGATIAIDDFGAGYSSFYHLREIPFDKVKFDRSFVSDLMNNPRAERFVLAVIRFCASLNLTTTAEEIEDAAVARKLKELGCAFGQGYAFSAPVHASDLASVMESLGPRHPRSDA